MTRRVLVVDDDALTLQILSTILDLEDFDVTTAQSGEDALASVAEAMPDLIVLDVMMPDIDGLEVTRRIRAMEAGSDVPIVLLTAKSQEADRAEGLAAGASEYVTKPFSPLGLIRTLSELDLRAKKRAS